MFPVIESAFVEGFGLSLLQSVLKCIPLSTNHVLMGAPGFVRECRLLNFVMVVPLNYCNHGFKFCVF